MLPINVFASEETYTEGLTFQKTTNGSTGEVYYTVYSYTGTADEVIIPDYYNGYPVKKINSRAFESKTMSSVKLPETLTEIGGSAFYKCTNLEKIEFPDSMETLFGASAFYGCTALKEVTFGDNLKSISSQAFIHCTALEAIYLPDSVTTINMSAFMECSNLKKVTGGKNLTSISSQAFNRCTSLESFVVGDKVESIGINAFSSCYNLKKITMGASLKSIDSSALAHCTSLEELYFKPGLEIIGDSAIRGCSSLEKIYLPSTVTTISSYAFYGCDALSDIYYEGTEEDFNLIDIDSEYNDVFFDANIHYNFCCTHEDVAIIEGKAPTCTELGLTEGLYCNTCGTIVREQAEIEKELHDLYWYHTDEMGENAFDLLCSKCSENFGRGYKNEDNNYYMFGYVENESYYHYVYNNEAEKITSEICETDYWITDENVHEGICKCHLILIEEEIHEYSIKKNDESGHWLECDVCGTKSEEEKHIYDNDCDSTCNDCDYQRTVNHSWIDATCTDAKSCKVCGVTQGDALGHLYKTVLTKATTSSNGSSKQVCSVCGDVKSTTTIYKISTVTLSQSNYTYNGKAQKPSVTVKNSKGTTLKNGTDYTISYASGRTKIGKYKVTVTFKGNYSGSKAVYFEIGPKNPSSVKTALYGYDDVKVSWSKVSGASGYKVYYKKSSASSWTLLKTTTATSYKKANLSDGVKYVFKVVAYKNVNGNACENAGKTSSIYTLKTVAGVKVAKSGTKVKVSWTNISGETGYQISQTTSKTGTKVVATYATTSGKYKTVSATKGKTYYYKVRAYKTVESTKIYGPWSNVGKYKR